MLGSEQLITVIRRSCAAAIGLALIAFSSGCGTADPGSRQQLAEQNAQHSSAPEVARGSELQPFVDRLCSTVAYDYELKESPRELAAWVDLVVTGTVESVAAGRQTGTDYPAPSQHIVVAVNVDQVVKAPDDGVTEGRVYFELPRRDDQPVSEFQDVLPPNAQVVLFAHDATVSSEADEDGVVDKGAGRPPSSRLYSPYPEGLFFGSEDGVVGCFEKLPFLAEQFPAWAGIDSLDELVSRTSG